MKKILGAIFFLTLILFLLDWSFSFFIQENRNIKVSNAMKGGARYDVLYHGPCEPLFTIDASYLDSITGLKSYNYALRHTDFADNYLHLYLYLQQNKAPKQVYLYVTPESFDARFNTFHTYRFAPYLSDSVVKAVVKDMDPDYYRYTWIPFMRFGYYNSYKLFDAIQGAKHYFSEKSNPYFKDGHIEHPDNEFYTRPDGYIAPEHLVFAADMDVTEITDSTIYYELYEERQTFTWDKKRADYLCKIFELCAAHNINLVLYESPAYEPSVRDQPNRAEFISKTDSIAQEYNSTYLLFNNSRIGTDKSNFVCPLILSVKGTKPFLNEFADSISRSIIEIKN